jgi:hypothetical protein
MDAFNAGDQVTLTRQSPNGQKFVITGTLTSALRENGRLISGAIHGRAKGRSEHSHFDLDAERMFRLYGVTQTLKREA